MKIVFANKYFYPATPPDPIILRYMEMLQANGHEVAPFAMENPKNLPSPWSKYFVSQVFNTNKPGVGWQELRTALRAVYSFEAKRKFGQLLDEFKPELVHVFGIEPQLSASILAAARERKIPIVRTVFDHVLVAPNYFLYHDGAICERTKPHKFWQALWHRCVKGSYLASGLAAFTMTLNRWLKLDWRALDRIVTPSKYIRDKYVEYGVAAERMVPVHYSIPTAGVTPKYTGDYALVVGRVSLEKGTAALIRAAAMVPEMPLKIVGTGPELENCKKLVAELGAENVEFLGFVDDLVPVYAGARFTVVPSTCYDAFPTVTLEAYAAGKPVLGADIGGITEQIIEGETGRLFKANDVEDLVAKMTAMWFSPVGCEAMGRQARQLAETEYSAERYYQRMMEVYGSVL